ncbi:MAG: cytochrome c biogenesis protein CcsA [Cardiobacteriaceae bacterium]|nr:cytochrome c biogenesis protein CcsA [Cardiobacteriaceae bacterium]
MQLWLPLFTLVAYVAGAVGFIYVYRKPTRRINPLWVLGILVCACQGHALTLLSSLQADNQLNLSIFNMVSVNAWFVTCISVFWLWRASMALGGVIICLVSAVAVVLPFLFVSYKPFSPHIAPGMWWHILTSIAAWTFISLAFLHALLYGWLFRRLKRKQLRDITVSSLVSLERVMMLQAVVGFIMLTAALFTGWMFIDDLFAQHLVHKTVLTIFAWFALAWMLFSYYVREQRGTTLVMEMFVAFILLLMGYVLSNVILQFIVN